MAWGLLCPAEMLPSLLAYLESKITGLRFLTMAKVPDKMDSEYGLYAQLKALKKHDSCFQHIEHNIPSGVYASKWDPVIFGFNFLSKTRKAAGDGIDVVPLISIEDSLKSPESLQDIFSKLEIKSSGKEALTLSNALINALLGFFRPLAERLSLVIATDCRPTRKTLTASAAAAPGGASTGGGAVPRKSGVGFDADEVSEWLSSYFIYLYGDTHDDDDDEDEDDEDEEDDEEDVYNVDRPSGVQGGTPMDSPAKLAPPPSPVPTAAEREQMAKDIAELDKIYGNCKIKIADLGNACWTHKQFTEDIQTRQYRSPEVILEMKYGTAVDMWSLACIVFELLTGDYLFDPRTGPDWSREEDHLALMWELVGPFPHYMVSSYAATTSATSGKGKAPTTPPPGFKLGKLTEAFFTKDGRLRHIKKLNMWDMYHVLLEKYRFSETESREIAEFLVPMLAVKCPPTHYVFFHL